MFVVLLVAGCGLAAVVSALPAGSHPDVDFGNDEITQAAAPKRAELEAQLADVGRRFGAPHVGRPGTHEFCEQGRDNFTRQDRWTYVCSLRIAQVVPVREPFEENASRLGEALVGGDCPDGTDTDRRLAEPYDDPQDLNSSRGDCTPGISMGAPEILGWLPARPTTDELERAETLLTARCYASDPHCELVPLDLQAAVAAAPEDAAWLAVVVADDAYYAIPWDCPWPASRFRDSCSRSGAGVR